MPISDQEFRDALRHWASGVTVVTTRDSDGNLHGLTVSAFSAVSLAPPLVLVCVDKTTYSYQAFAKSRIFAVNILSENQHQISHQFALPVAEKFAGIEFADGIAGVPLLAGALVNLECRLVFNYDGGDHSILVGEIERTTIRTGKPLLYFNGNYGKIEP